MRGIKLAVTVLVGVGAAGCGPKGRPPVTSADAPDPRAGGGGGAPVQGGSAVTPERICARILELKGQRCELAESYELSDAECQVDMRRSLEERGNEARDATTAAARCLLDNDSCQAATTCMASLNEFSNEQDGTPTTFRTCAETSEYAPVGRSAADWAKRRGAGARKYRDVVTAKESPVEVCGIPAQMEWLLAARCDDGSLPFRNQADDSPSYDRAHAARVGNVGAGGACGSIIDVYEVPCPEATYRIFIDAYVCALPD